jgi:hypothetical protein
MTEVDWRTSGPAYGFAGRSRIRKSRAGNKNNRRREGTITAETIIGSASNREGNSSTKSRRSHDTDDESDENPRPAKRWRLSLVFPSVLPIPPLECSPKL